ncbi:MAG: FapA family protein [candidate division Zixibacteria bacterium]|jgi:uncharacterized protein (DUF342 family)|nr:FapA family protein [candidate division Zixibacteria bacterium]
MAGSSVSTRKRVRITVSGDSMSATMVLYKPEQADPPVTVDEVKEALEAEGVIYGIDEKEIARGVEEQIYVTPIKVAGGDLPNPGVSARFDYHFDTTNQRTPKEDQDGRIDYKDISFIQNTHVGDVLVTKIPPTRGTPGKNVFGKEIQGPMGRDIPFKRGTNTRVSDDGMTLIATASGAIVFQKGKVSVNDVTVIRGDVDFNVGNIDCAGSVKVSGSVKTGFTIKVDGNLEVEGNVEDSTIEVAGSVYIKGGFFGEGKGILRAENDIVVKYAEGQRLEAGGTVTVGGEIINCTVTAAHNIEVKGNRGKIIGGMVRAGKSVRASVFGSDAGTKTVVIAGYNPELIARYNDTVKEIMRLAEDAKRIKEALYSLYRLQMDGKLPADKKAALAKLETVQKAIPGSIEELGKQKAELEEKLKQFENANVIADTIIYPGVRVQFGVVYREFVEERERVKVTCDNGQVMVSAIRE